MIPKHAFELTIFHRDGKTQQREYERLDTAVEAARTLRPATVRGYKLTVVVEYRALQDPALDRYPRRVL